METVFQLLLFFFAIFMILLVLVQKGKGGGLAGALGGAGGSSAFGARAGDKATWFTIYTATTWILLCVAAAYWAGNRGDALGDDDPAALLSQPGILSVDTDAEKTDAEETTTPAADGASASEPADASTAEVNADETSNEN